MGNSLLIDSLTPVLLQTLSANVLLGDLLTNLGQWTQVALGLGFVIFVHELGHFLAAKTFGVRCDKFYVGFDPPIKIGPFNLPRTLGKFTWGETEYGIGIIPLGGYVKMLGQDDDPRKAEEEAAASRMGDDEDAPLDPRSYPAKPVWQRMIIISAGVVMNLISAVIIAGIAYFYGVPYSPTVTGSVVAGGPAWQAGLQPGDQILKVGDMKDDLEQFRYDDFRMDILLHGFDHQETALPLTYRRDGKIYQTSVNPTAAFLPHPRHKLYSIGVNGSLTPIVGATPTEETYIAQFKPDLKPGDKVLAVNGEELPVDPRFNAVVGNELTKRFQENWNQAVTLSLERPPEDGGGASSKLEVEIPAVPVKSIDIGFAMGPVTALQKGSPAEDSGIKPGDIIRTINGEEITDALELPNRVAMLAGQEVTLGVERGSEGDSSVETLEFAITAKPKASFDSFGPPSAKLTLAGLGIAFAVDPAVSSVTEAAADSGFQVGDELLQMHWQVAEEEKEKLLESAFTEKAFEPLVIDKSTNLPYVFHLMQSMPEGSTFKCTVKRDGKVTEGIKAQLSYQPDWFWHMRSIRMRSLEDTHYATSIADAAKLGLWETSRRFQGVLQFLRMLVTGRIGLSGLGGPLRIAEVAATEASHGTSRLLLFLTMLSANLAILNFLPIPALDGGHMVFLTCEAIRGKPVNEELQMRLTMMGVLSLLCLMAFVIVKDILFYTT